MCIRDRPSLAYLAYSDSADQGVSVAKVNMAQKTKANVPAAGLKLLQEHIGGYDAADRGYPHAVRAELERLVQEEGEQAKQRAKYGKRQYAALSSFAWEAIRGTTRLEGRFQNASSTVNFSPEDDDSISLAFDDGTLSLTTEGNTLPIVIGASGDDTKLFLSLIHI